jgi:SAM-dependent methyltransferase
VMDAEAFRAESRRGWGSVAQAWADQPAAHVADGMPVTEKMLDLARLQPGHQVLELAAGPGEVGFFAWELIQPGGRLITTDFAPEMLAQAQRRAERLGLTGVRFKQVDAESIDWPAADLDAVLCRWGFMLMADPGAALRECRRVLKPGGRLVLAAWTAAEDNRWSSVVGQVLTARGLASPPDPDAPGQFAWGREGLIAERLEEAGFVEEIAVEAVDFAYRETFEQWWDRTLAMARSAAVILERAPAEQAEIRAELQSELARYDRGDGVLELPARTWVAGATA